MMQPWENGKNPNLGPPTFFSWVLPLVVGRQCPKLSSYAISRKTNEPNLKRWQKNKFLAQFWPVLAQIWSPNFFSWVLSLLDVTHCCKWSLYVISRKTNEPDLRKCQKKTSFRPNFGPKFGSQKLFLKVFPLLDVRNCCKLWLYAISRKTNEPNLRKLQKT